MIKSALYAVFALATGLTLAQSASGLPDRFSTSIAPMVAAKPAKRNSNMIFPQGIQVKPGINVEQAQIALFKDGDYIKAREYLTTALKTDPNEPLTYAMNTLYPFSSGDYEQVKAYGNKTIEVAKRLSKTDPLRGNLYQGVGLAILGAYEMKRDNGGALGALSKLQKVFEYMDRAKKIDPNSRELNLIQGYMNLLLAVNVPFSDTQQAIAQLRNAEPKYLAWRGIYIGYRDLKEYGRATVAIDKAISLAPNNPELTYYKAQILAIRGREKKNDNDLKQSIQLFETAYAKRDRLLIGTIAQILSERCQAKSALNRTSNDACWGFEAQLKKDNPNRVVGLSNLPPLK